ncbi:MAG: helix-hairpin-helix domain-containing protein, partial [Bacillota bacterium]
EELPDLDVSLRGAVSIARRIQDPLAELVKIDPRSLGVGMYQHDMAQTRLVDALDAVVESCVNRVGVDVNTASVALLTYVSGLGPGLAAAIVTRRQDAGPFNSRADLLEVSGMGPKTFTQAAGFLRVTDGECPLDNTWVHPESYDAARAILRYAGQDEAQLAEDQAGVTAAVGQLDPAEMAERVDLGLPTVRDIIQSLRRPGLDPRQDMPAPILRSDILSIEALQPGQVLLGTVRNVVDFGAFVDIGVGRDGLVHISELSDRFVRDPNDVVAVADVVTVRVREVDVERGRISLSMRDF